MKYDEYIKIILELNNKFRYLKSIESLFELDQWSSLPKKGGKYRQQMAAYISDQKSRLFFTEDAKKVAEYFQNINTADADIENNVERGLIRTFKT